MSFSHKENAKKLFSRDNIGGYWNDLYKDVRTCLDLHFVKRLEMATALVDQYGQVGSRILDLGCGAGVLSEQLLLRGHQVVAADQSQDMLDFAQQRLAQFDKSCYQLVRTECERLDFPDNSFDVVACIGVFGYIDDVDSAIAEIYRVLKPGGTLIMSIRNVDNLNIFDVKQIAKNIFVRMPLKLLKKVRKPAQRNFPVLPDTKESGAKYRRVFIDIFDRPRDVIAIFAGHKLLLHDFHGVGYGPFQYNKRPLLPAFLAKKKSLALEYLFRRFGVYQKTKWFADISLYVFTK